MSRNLEKVLSPERLSTYKNAMNSNLEKAIRLYQWNADISGAFLPVLQVLEVTIRNAIAEAIELVYGPNWASEQSFILSLPDNKEQRQPLQKAARKHPGSTGKVIAEMNFIFWQKMFTRRFAGNIWNTHFSHIFPNTSTATVSISTLYNELDSIRRLRNRIAHHEPIFNRNLADDLDQILRIISYRNSSASDWVKNNQTIIAILARKPLK